MCPVIKKDGVSNATAVGKLTALNIANFTEQASKIISRARDDADEIIAKARAEAQEIIDQANAQIEQANVEAEKIKADAETNGYAEGRQRGEAEGQADGAEKAFNEATERFDKQCGRLKQLLALSVEQLGEAREDLLRQAKAEMLQFALEIASRVTNYQARGDIRAAEEILKKVVSAAPCARKLKIRISQEQYDHLSVYAGDFIRQINSGSEVEVVADEILSCGDVMVESPEGGVDGRVEVQFDNIARALAGHQYQPMSFEQENAESDVADAQVSEAAEPEENSTPADEEIAASENTEEDSSLEEIIDRTGEIIEELSGQLASKAEDADSDDAAEDAENTGESAALPENSEPADETDDSEVGK